MDTWVSSGPAETPSFVEEALFTLPPGCSPDAVTSDGHTVAFLSQPDGLIRFVWDDTAGEPFDQVPDMRDKLPAVFSSENGAHVAYAGQRGESIFIGRDSTEDPPGGGLSRSVPPVFSPDGRHLAYGGYKTGEFRLIVDGQATGEFPIAPIAAVFSPDGDRLAYVEVREVTQHAFEQRIVVDGAPGPWFVGMRNARGAMQFSPDSRRFAYYRIDGQGHSQWIVDGVAQRMMNDVRALGIPQLGGIGVLEDPLVAGFSPDSRRFVYFADVMEKGVAIVEDDVPGPLFEALGAPVFSADSRHVAYVGQASSNQVTLVVDGTAGPAWQGASTGTPVFSPDGRHVALTIHREAGNILRRRHFYALVVDGNIVTELEGDEASRAPVFDPDGTRVAWWVLRGTVPMMLVNETPLPEGMLGWGEPVFTSAGHLMYEALFESGSGSILVDGRPGPLADVLIDRQSTIRVFDDPRTHGLTLNFCVSPDGNHVIWAGLFGEEQRPIYDDQVGPGFDRIISSVFTPDGRAIWWAQRGDVMYRVTA